MAHQQKESYTTVNFNQRTSNIEVVHRFYLHDAEHAINRMLDTKADIINNKQSQAAFAQYVKQNFGLRVMKVQSYRYIMSALRLKGNTCGCIRKFHLRIAFLKKTQFKPKLFKKALLKKTLFKKTLCKKAL